MGRCGVAALLAALLSVLFCPGASGVGDDCLATRRVVVFGDSLSSIDAGRVYSVARKSNGKLWVEYADLPMLTDLALAGATATVQYASAAISNPRRALSGQLQQYLSASPQDLNSSCFVVFIGQNDISYTAGQLLKSNSDAAIIIVNILTDIVGAVARVAARGGRCFFVFDLPDLLRFPAVRNSFLTYSTDITTLSDMYNALLREQLAALSLPRGTFLSVVDTVSAFHTALNGTAPNGSAWTSTTAQCVIAPQPNVSYDCGLRFWFDGYHPTTAAHFRLSQQFMTQMCEALEAFPSPSPEPKENAAPQPFYRGAWPWAALCTLTLAVAWTL
eukprot:EG_transcript_10818